MKNYTAADFGPNGEAVAALIERIKNLTPDQAMELGGTWNAARYAVLDAARSAAWTAAWGSVWGAVWDAVRGAVWDAVREESRDSIWYAVRAATIALATQDLISEEDFNTLYGPWASVMEAGK